MNNQRQLLLGIFFIVALSILAFYTLFLTDIHLFSKPILMSVYFPDANGLRVGDPVQVLGTRIGRVKECTFNTTAEERQRVHTVLSLDREIELVEGARITIRETSLLGGRHVDIDPGPFGGKPFESPDGAFYGEVYKNPIAMLGDIGVLLNENRAAINGFLTNLDVITGDIRAGKGLIGKLIEDPELAQDAKDVVADAKQLVANAREASEQLQNGQGLLGALIYDTALRDSVTNTFDRIDRIGADLESQQGVLGSLIYDSALKDKVTAGVDSFVSFGRKLDGGEGALGLLLSDPETKEQVKTLVGNLSTTSADIKALVADVRSGEGTLGKLLSDDELYEQARQAIGLLTRSLEDYREAAPITAFTSVLFAAW